MISFMEVVGKTPLEEIPKHHINNINELIQKVNIFRLHFGEKMFVSSGYRTKERHIEIYRKINEDRKAKGLAPVRVPMGSFHLFGLAVDFFDGQGKIIDFCRENEDLLEKIGIWIEDGTKDWVHMQVRAPGSKKRFFKP